MNRTRLLKLYVISCIAFMVFVTRGITVQAKTINTGEVVSYINELRAEMGLPAFSVY